MPFFLVEHTADLAVRLEAPDHAGLLTELTAALSYLYSGDSPPTMRRALDLELTASTLEELLVKWANELIFLFDAEGHVPLRVSELVVESGVEGHVVRGSLAAGSVHEPGFEPDNDLKAATYHDLAVQQKSGRLAATLVIDT